MFIIDITYKKPLREVEQVLVEHVDYLEKHYQRKEFICSGRKNPRDGGIILSTIKDADTLKAILKEDPFYRDGIADYRVVEFFPTKFAPGLEAFF